MKCSLYCGIVQGKHECFNLPNHELVLPNPEIDVPDIPKEFKADCSIMSLDNSALSSRQIYELYLKGWSLNDSSSKYQIKLSSSAKTSLRPNTHPCDMEIKPHMLYCENSYFVEMQGFELESISEETKKCSDGTGSLEKQCTLGFENSIVPKLKKCSDVLPGKVLN